MLTGSRTYAHSRLRLLILLVTVCNPSYAVGKGLTLDWKVLANEGRPSLIRSPSNGATLEPPKEEPAVTAGRLSTLYRTRFKFSVARRMSR